MNITGKDREGHVPPSCFPSAFVVISQAKSKDTTERPCQSSRLSGSFVSSSSVQFLSEQLVTTTSSLQRLQLSRGEFACLNKEFPRTEKEFPRTTQ